MSKSFSIHNLSRFLKHGRDRFLECANTPPWGLGKWTEFEELLETMRSHIPVPGDTWVKDIHVLVEPGSLIAAHSHPEWTAIFYADPGTPPCAIIIEGERYEPKPGELVILSPNTVHEVEKSNADDTRISFAMLVEAEDDVERA